MFACSENGPTVFIVWLKDPQYPYRETSIMLKATSWACLKCVELGCPLLEGLITYWLLSAFDSNVIHGIDQVHHQGLATIILLWQTIRTYTDNLNVYRQSGMWHRGRRVQWDRCMSAQQGDGLVGNCVPLVHWPFSDTIWQWYKSYFTSY